MTPHRAMMTATDFNRVSWSPGSIITEKVMGNITDILLATVVTEIPALFVEKDTRKNMMINMIPIMMLIGSHFE